MPDDIESIVRNLNPFQVEFLSAPDKYVGGYGGIRNGKTWIACVKGIILSLQFPGNRGLVGRLTYNELRDSTAKEFLNFVAQLNGGNLRPGPIVKSWKDLPIGELTFTNGSEVLFRYMSQPTSVLSMTLGWFYVDQAEYIPEATYTHLEGRLSLWGPENVERCRRDYQRLHGAPLTRTPKDVGFITGNPAPGWVHSRYKLNPTGKYKLIEASTAANKANIAADYLDSLRATNSELWVKRFLEGDWDTFAGQIYKEYQASIHNVEPFEIPDHWPRFLGWDHGQENPTAVCFVCVDEDGNCIVYKEHYKVSPRLEDHADAVKALSLGDAVRRSEQGAIIVYMDPSTKGRSDMEGRNFMQHYADMGIIGIGANNQVNAGIQKVQQLLHANPNRQFPRWHPRAGEYGAPKLYFVADALPATLHELSLYQWELVPEGKEANAKEKPRKYLDHAMDALRYAVMAIFENAPREEKVLIPTYNDWVLNKIMEDSPFSGEDDGFGED